MYTYSLTEGVRVLTYVHDILFCPLYKYNKINLQAKLSVYIIMQLTKN